MEPETIRDLYAALAQGWVDGGATRHWAMVPAFDGTLAGAWSRLSFGQQHAQGIREVPAAAVPNGVRAARADDIDQLIELSYLLPRHTAASPVFSGVDPSDPMRRARRFWRSWRTSDMGSLVAVDGERIVGGIVVVDVEESQAHTAIARPDGAAHLAWAAVRPEARGTGAGLRLTDAAFAWAHEHGYGVIVTDWRVTNLEASRFWPLRVPHDVPAHVPVGAVGAGRRLAAPGPPRWLPPERESGSSLTPPWALVATQRGSG